MLALATVSSVRVTLVRMAGCSLQTRYPVLTWTCSAVPVSAKPAVQFLVTFNPAANFWMLHVAVPDVAVIVLGPGPVAVAVTVSMQEAPRHCDVVSVSVAP